MQEETVMNVLEAMRAGISYVSTNDQNPNDLQKKAHLLCWKYNQISPDDRKSQIAVLKELFTNCSDQTFVNPSFHCDYGFNIHTEGLCIINYNCVILDTSPVRIGENAFIAPGVIIACSGHSVDAEERAEGIGTSAPITIEKDVWIGAGAVILGGVTIGEGSVIAAGAVITKDIPAHSVAGSVPAKVIREVTEKDRIRFRIQK